MAVLMGWGRPLVADTLFNIDHTNTDMSNPWVISSHSNQMDQIVNARGLSLTNAAYLTIESGSTFSNNIYSNKTSNPYGNLHGNIISAENTVLNAGDSISFIGNSFDTRGNTYGVIYSKANGIGNGNSFHFGDGTLFQSNSAKYAGAIHSVIDDGAVDTYSFGNNTRFIDNQSINYGGAIQLWGYAGNNFETIIAMDFGDQTLFQGNSGARGGAISQDTYVTGTGIVHNFVNFNGDVKFDSNTATRYGGAIYSEIGGNSTGQTHTKFNFFGTTEFVNNSAGDLGGAILFWPTEDAGAESELNFTPKNPGQYVLFENNTAGGNLNSLYMLSGAVNLNLQTGTYANFRDPIVMQTGLDMNKGSDGVPDGNGGLYIWGKNDQFYGNLNINTGSFYAMFEEHQTPDQIAADPNGQRTDFSMSQAKINFASGTFFRPMMNAAHNGLAHLNMANVSGASNAILAPYAISKLDLGDYTFANNYDGFQGFDSELAELSINGTSDVQLRIKRDLAGYKGLGDAADAYRRSDLNFIDRQEIDDVFLTGEVTQGLLDQFEIIGGLDYMNSQQVHRASIRQFARQVNARIKDDNFMHPNLDRHFWSHNSFGHVKRNRTSNHMGYRYDPMGIAFGYDRDLYDDALTVGGAVSFIIGDIETDADEIQSMNRASNFLASTYGAYRFAPWILNWNAGGALIHNSLELTKNTDTTRGRFNNIAGFANIDMGYDFDWKDRYTLTPYIGAEYLFLHANDYTEQGSVPRYFDSGNWHFLDVPIGLRFAFDFWAGEWLVTPKLDVAYARSFGDTTLKTRAAFTTNLNDDWTVFSESEAKDTLRAEFNLKLNFLGHHRSFNMGYAIDYRSDYMDSQFYFTFRTDF